MLTDDGLASLRMAATLALTLPTVRVRIASPTRVLAEVGWSFDGGHWGDTPRPPGLGDTPRPPGLGDTPRPPGLGEGVRLRPCAFRMAVGRAWGQRREGSEVDFCGLGDHEPAISLAVGPGERVLPGDIYQVRAEGGGWHHVLATVLPPESCVAVIGTGGPAMALHDDPITGVTLVHTRTEGPQPDELPHLAPHLTALRGRLLAEELLADPLVTGSREL